MRNAVLVQVSPVRATLYRQGADGTVYNRFHLKAANRSGTEQTVVLGIEELPGTHFEGFENAVIVNAAQTQDFDFEIAAPVVAGLTPGVNHFRLTSRVGNEKESFDETFITPFKDSK